MASGVQGGKIYVTGGEGQDYTHVHLARARGLRAVEQQLDHAAEHARVAPRPRRCDRRQPAAHGERRVQSAGTGVHVHTDSHDAYDFDAAKK